MPPIQDKIQEDLKKAMKEKNETEVSVLRMLQADLRNKKIAKKDDLSDDDVMKAITSAVKQRKDAAESFREGDREDSAKKEEEEIEVLKRFLPEEMSEDALRALVAETIEQTGAAGMSDIGKVMGTMMQKVKGRADGEFVKKLVEEVLKQTESE